MIWTTLNPVKHSPLMTPPLSTSWTPIPPLTLSIKPTSIMSLNTPPLIMDLLLIGEPMVAFAVSDVRILERTGRTVSVTGIDNHELPGLDIVTCAALLHTNHGKWFSSCMSMPIMVEATQSTLQVKLNGSRTPVMTNPSMWEGNKLSTSLMACRILGLTALNSLLQYVNWLVWEVCSVN